MSFFTEILQKDNFISRLFKKLQYSNLQVPTVREIFPYYIAVIIGILLASLVGFFIAWWQLPNPAAPGKNKEAIDVFLQQPATLIFPERPMLSDFDNITKRNIFNSDGKLATSENGAQCALVKSELPLKFTGVIYGGSARSSLVLLESTSNNQADPFLFGDKVAEGITITDIQRNKVIFEKNGCPEFLELQEPPMPPQRRASQAGSRRAKRAQASSSPISGAFKEDGFERESNNVQATRQWVDKALSVDLPKTLQDAKAVPNMVNGQIKGFKLTRIRPDSVYEKMGFTNDDVIQSINGIDLNDAARAISTLNSLRNEKNIDVTVTRNGQTFNMKVQVF